MKPVSPLQTRKRHSSNAHHQAVSFTRNALFLFCLMKLCSVLAKVPQPPLTTLATANLFLLWTSMAPFCTQKFGGLFFFNGLLSYFYLPDYIFHPMKYLTNPSYITNAQYNQLVVWTVIKGWLPLLRSREHWHENILVKERSCGQWAWEMLCVISYLAIYNASLHAKDSENSAVTKLV